MEGVVAGGTHGQIECSEPTGEREFANEVYVGASPVGSGDLCLRDTDLETQPLQSRQNGPGVVTRVIDVARAQRPQSQPTVRRQPQPPACGRTVIQFVGVQQGPRAEAYAGGIRGRALVI